MSCAQVPRAWGRDPSPGDICRTSLVTLITRGSIPWVPKYWLILDIRSLEPIGNCVFFLGGGGLRVFEHVIEQRVTLYFYSLSP